MDQIVFTSNKVFLDEGIIPASIIVQNGKITGICTATNWINYDIENTKVK